MKRSIALSLALCFCLLSVFPFVACKNPAVFDPNAVGVPSVEVDTSYGKTDAEMFTERDKRVDYDAASAVRISLETNKITCDAEDVKVEGSTATILGGGTYILSGKLEGNIVVYAGDLEKPHIVLDGVDIISSSASIFVVNADKVFITLAPGSENILINDGGFAPVGNVNVDGVIYSTADLSLNGSGTLEVYSLGGHGIVSNDDLVIAGGNYEIEAVGHALKGNDSVRVCGNSTFALTAGKDGLHAENNDPAKGFVYLAGGSYTIAADGDGISASGTMQIRAGSYAITTGGGHNAVAAGSAKGLKSGGGMLLEGGSFTIDAKDDALHSDRDLVVKGGSFSVKTGDDAAHADVTLAVFGGTLDVTESYEGLEAMHVEMLGGKVTLACDDDGINAAGGNDDSGTGGDFGDDFAQNATDGSVNVAGGDLYINAAGDGIDTNGSFTMSSGRVTVCGPTQGNTAVLDYDKSAIITGGFFIGTGSHMVAQTFSTESTQGVIALSVGSQAAGTEISIKGGSVSFSYTPTLPFRIFIISTPDMVKGEEYAVTIGELSGNFAAY